MVVKATLFWDEESEAFVSKPLRISVERYDLIIGAWASDVHKTLTCINECDLIMSRLSYLCLCEILMHYKARHVVHELLISVRMSRFSIGLTFSS